MVGLRIDHDLIPDTRGMHPIKEAEAWDNAVAIQHTRNLENVQERLQEEAERKEKTAQRLIDEELGPVRYTPADF